MKEHSIQRMVPSVRAELDAQSLTPILRLRMRISGQNVFLLGLEVVPDEGRDKDPNAEFFFTNEKGETSH